MPKTKHTHTGSCQACGARQAVDNTTQYIAKHGYTVDHGVFNGTCPGSGFKPAELDIYLTRDTIIWCLDEAKRFDTHVLDTLSGKYTPPTFERWNRNKKVIKRSRGRHSRPYESLGGFDTLAITEATPVEYTQRINIEIRNAENKKRHHKDHAEMLTRDVLPRLGQPLKTVEQKIKRTYVKGMRLTIGDREIELTTPAYDMYAERQVGWMAKYANQPNSREYRYSTRELNQGTVKP